MWIVWINALCAIYYHLYNSKKCEKHPWKSATFSKVAGLQILPHCAKHHNELCKLYEHKLLFLKA